MKLRPLSGDELTVFNMVAHAAVTEDRQELAQALWRARQHGKDFRDYCTCQAAWIGWPVRARPNGTYH